ncbi:MAG: PLDc N-terminal domain-containing protein [Gaiellaceae bacterium]
MYWTLGIIYVVLSVAFIADVLRNPALSTGGKALWIVALLVVPVVAWLGYGIWRLRQSRGLTGA